MTARSVAWPFPVKASEPWRMARMRRVAGGGGDGGGSSLRRSASSSRKAPAAAIGPIVWDEDGPMPTLNMSKTLKNI